MLAKLNFYKNQIISKYYSLSTKKNIIGNYNDSKDSLIIGTRKGLFLYNFKDGLEKIIDGWFYGLAIDKKTIYAFQKINSSGRIISFNFKNNKITNPSVLISGLSSGVHQIEINDNKIYICDTYSNSKIIYDLIKKRNTRVEKPFGNNYKHINSIYFDKNSIYLFLHNKTHISGINSQLATFNKDFQLISLKELSSQNGHNFLIDDQNSYYFNSNKGYFLKNDEIVFSKEYFLRGLAKTKKYFFIGGSSFANRGERDLTKGVLFILDVDFKLIEELNIPGNVQEIRLLNKI